MPASINLSLLAGSFGFKLPTLFENSFFLKKKLLLLWKVYCSYMTARDISLTQDTNYRTEKRSNYQYRNNVRDSTTEHIGAWCVARVLQPTMWGQRGVQSGCAGLAPLLACNAPANPRSLVLPRSRACMSWEARR